MSEQNSQQPTSAAVPFFIRQIGDLLSEEQLSGKLAEARRQAEAEGAVMWRVSSHPTIPHLIIFEAWRTHISRPGEPRWSLTSEAP